MPNFSVIMDSYRSDANIQVQEDLGGRGEIPGICEFCDQRDGGILFDLFKNLSIFFLKTEYAGIKGGCG